jgi:hypothetical protein
MLPCRCLLMRVPELHSLSRSRSLSFFSPCCDASTRLGRTKLSKFAAAARFHHRSLSWKLASRAIHVEPHVSIVACRALAAVAVAASFSGRAKLERPSMADVPREHEA